MQVSISWLKELVDLNCSIRELINLLPLRSVSIKEVTESYIELDMKGYNRADLLSMRGIAYEVAAITGSRILFEEPEEAEFAWNTQKLPNTNVTIANPELCHFFTLTKIEGLKVGPSPKEWIEKLGSSGIRSVNNIADITNLIMLEYGQPMHSFDADRVQGEKIIVRTARENEEIKTLDGKLRKLTSADLLITDPQKLIGIAGVMGGENTEVTTSTTNILLEAAIFNPVCIRKTTTGLGLPSEASKRFQHGLTKIRLMQAVNGAIKLYEQLGGKITAITIKGDYGDKDKRVTLRKQKLEELVGVKFENQQVEGYLENLYFKPYVSSDSYLERGSTTQRGRIWEVEVPYFRLDINIEEDVIEEAARMYGYEKIPAAKVDESEPLQQEDPIFQKISDLRNKLVELGLTEVQTYSFYSTEVIKTLNLDEKKLVKIANPISAGTEYLRQTIWPNLVEVVGKNIRKGYKDIGIFEIGKAFNPGPDGSPEENYRLAIALMNGTDNPLEELYQITKTLASHILSGNTSGNTVQTNPPIVATHFFHPTRHIGPLAEVHLRVLNKLGIEKRVAVLEISI